MPGQHVATMLANDGKIKYIHVLLFFFAGACLAS